MKLHIIKGYIQNIHLVEYDHGCLLLDGCCRVDLQEILNFFKHTLNRPISDLHIILVTHMHPDHAGCAQVLRKISGARIVMGQSDGHWYKGIKGRIAHLVDMALALWVAGRMGKKRKNIWYSPTLYADCVLTDGSPIPDFEDWSVIYTPGHTDRDISAVNQTGQLIYVADLIVQVKRKLLPPFPVYLPQAYKQSLQKIKQYNGYKMLMAHVEPLEIVQSEIDTIIAAAPSSPKTNHFAIKNKIKRVLFGK